MKRSPVFSSATDTSTWLSDSRQSSHTSMRSFVRWSSSRRVSFMARISSHHRALTGQGATRRPWKRLARRSYGGESRTSSSACAGLSFSRASSSPNQPARSTSGNSCMRPERGGHSIVNVLLAIGVGVEVALDRERRDLLAAAQLDGAQLGELGAVGQRRPELLLELARGARARVLAVARTRPWGSTRRRRPCAPRTARRDARAAPRGRRRACGAAGSRRCASGRLRDGLLSARAGEHERRQEREQRAAGADGEREREARSRSARRCRPGCWRR